MNTRTPTPMRPIDAVIDDSASLAGFVPGMGVSDPLVAWWLNQVTARLRRHVRWLQHITGHTYAADDSPHDSAELVFLLSKTHNEKLKFFETDPTAGYLTRSMRARRPQQYSMAPGSFKWIVDALRLTDAETFVLALALTPSLDSSFGEAASICASGPTRGSATLALAQKLWDAPEEIVACADLSHALFAYHLVNCQGSTSHGHMVEWETPLWVLPAIARGFLFGDSAPIPGLCRIEGAGEDRYGARTRVVAMGLANRASRRLSAVPVVGPQGSAFADAVASCAAVSGRPVYEVSDTSALLDSEGAFDAAVLWCWMHGADLFLGSSFAQCGVEECQRLCQLLRRCERTAIAIYVACADRHAANALPAHLLAPAMEIPPLSFEERRLLWERALGVDSGAPIVRCARSFRFGKESIERVARGLAGTRGTVDPALLIEACRAESTNGLDDLAQHITPRFAAGDLILPPQQHQQFHEILNAMRSLTTVHYEWGTARPWNEGGIAALFSGPPGTGKTMAAEVLSVELDLPLYRIDLSQVVNKYIGETEKNLKRLFDAADAADVILFFDEADALFGRRTEVKDAHDRYANLEISYLLERMERFKGLAILATNRKGDLDEAFLRRLRYLIDFPLPDQKRREQLWQTLPPRGVDISLLDTGFLAKQFPLAGGYIRTILFNACLLRAGKAGSERSLRMEDVIVCVKREYDKINRTLGIEHFGSYGHIVAEAMHE